MSKIKPLIIQKTANGYIVAAVSLSGNSLMFPDVSEMQCFTSLTRSVSYMHDGIEDFLEAYFNPPEPTPPAQPEAGKDAA